MRSERPKANGNGGNPPKAPEASLAFGGAGRPGNRQPGWSTATFNERHAALDLKPLAEVL